MNNLLSYLVNQVRDHDRDRFLCVLFTRKEIREALITLLAFNSEIAKVSEMVREPALGNIRLQWWRDCIEMIYLSPSDKEPEYPLVYYLKDVIHRFNLSRQLFDQIIDARFINISADCHRDETALRSYAHATSANLCFLIMEVLCPSGFYISQDDLKAAEYIGTGWALTGLLRSSSFLALNNRTQIPETLIKKYKINKNDIFARKATPEILLATSFQVDLARSEIKSGIKLLDESAQKCYLPLLLQARLAELFLDRLENFDFNPFSEKIEFGYIVRQLKIALTAVRALF